MTERQDSESPKAVSPWSREIARAALVDLVSRAFVVVALAFGGAIALLIIEGGDVPAWPAAIIVAIALAIAFVSRRRVTSLARGLARRDARIAELEPLVAEVDEQQELLERYEFAIDRYATYTEHLGLMLDHLQRVVARDIALPIRDFIQRGVMDPGKDVLAQTPAEDVRLSVLVPDGEFFTMKWAAGHNFNSQTKYRQPIADTLAGLAFQTGDVHSWDDVLEDDRFIPNPAATRPLRSMVAVPIHNADQIVGVFVAISSEPESFDEADISYIESLASVIGVAVSVALQETTQRPSTG